MEDKGYINSETEKMEVGIRSHVGLPILMDKMIATGNK